MSRKRLERLAAQNATLAEDAAVLEQLQAAKRAWSVGDSSEAAERVRAAGTWWSCSPGLRDNDPMRLLEAAVLLSCHGETIRARELLDASNGGVVAAVCAALLLAAEENWDEAFARLDPWYPGLEREATTNLLLGFFDLARAAWESAGSYGQRLQELAGHSRTGLWLSAVSALGAGRKNDALTPLLQLQEQHPEATVSLLLAELALEDGNAGLALQRLDEAARAGTDFPLLRAWTLFILGRLDEAERLLEHQPGGGARLRLRGDLAVTRGRYADALPFYREYLRENPDETTTRVNLSQCLLLCGRAGEAAEILAPLLAMSPPPQRAHDLAWRIEAVRNIETRLDPDRRGGATV